MLKGFFSAASGMVGILSAQEVITNNIANFLTPGYKRDIPIYTSFSRVLEESWRGEEGQSRMEETFVDFRDGKIKATERKLDLAIKGEGFFFAILTPEGVAYTRAGKFTLDKEGRVVTEEGYFLLGTKEPVIFIPYNSEDIRINEKGEITAGEEVIDKIRIEFFPEPAKQLYKAGKNFFRVKSNNFSEGKNTAYFVKQGYLELSNVDIIQETINLLVNFRIYEAAQKAINMQDTTLEKLCSYLS